jgi:hypothetical protein
LNVDYKILSHMVSNRIKTVLDSIIHNDQKGYIRRRQALDVVLRTMAILKVSKLDDESICLIDFAKAFDSIQHGFLWEAMVRFNFPKNIIHICKLLYTDSSRFYINKNF